MATPSRFNRPYGNSAQGQASWEKINRPDRQLGDQSLANQPATASGRGYYDPARILERVARGRPGTTMQQADAARDAYGMGVVNKLLDQNQQRLDQGQGGMGTGGTQQQGQGQGQGIPTFTPNQNLLTGYMNQLGEAPATVAPTTPLTKPKKPLPAPPALQSSITPDQAGETMPSWFKPFGL